ncbi:MAG: hypothetical protein CL920_02715 [Deltaproteobacteria bacterium]|nr:hypothetical protein [Deltaproteobacteria bacterium]
MRKHKPKKTANVLSRLRPRQGMFSDVEMQGKQIGFAFRQKGSESKVAAKNERRCRREFKRASKSYQIVCKLSELIHCHHAERCAKMRNIRLRNVSTNVHSHRGNEENERGQSR